MLLPSTTTRRVYERTHAGGSDGIAGVFGRTKLSRRPPRTQLRSVAFSAMTTGDDLRRLMRLWPHGVSILSVDVEGDRMGVTVSSLVSLSLEPPLEGALGWIEAETRTEADAGDHTFFIADVLSIEHGPSHHALVYRESTYHSV